MKNAVAFKAVRISICLVAVCIVITIWQLSKPPCFIGSSKMDATGETITTGVEQPGNSDSTPQIAGDIGTNHLPRKELELLRKELQTNYSAIWMSSMEVNLVLRYMHGVRNYFEWGSGGSTFNFPQFASDAAVSVEHNEGWCAHVRQTIARKRTLKKLAYFCIPVPRGHMGWGIKSALEEGTYPIFRDYIDQIDSAGHEQYDLILIDGRARVDAAIKALSYLDERSVVVIHDAMRIWGRTHAYKQVLEYYSVMDTCGGGGRQGIAVLKRKAKFDKLEKNHTAVQQVLNNRYGL